MKHPRSISITLSALSLVITAALAQEIGPGTFDLSWNTVDGGGGTSSGSAFEVSGTAGQPDAAPGSMSGGAFALSGGFWPGAVPVPTPCTGDITGDGLVNVNDLLAVINGWGPCLVPCPPHCAPDVSPIGGDCQVNVNDLLVVINAWGVCP